MGVGRRSAQEVIGDAERVVRRARGRLSLARGLDWAVRGALAGASAGLALTGLSAAGLNVMGLATAVHFADGASALFLLSLPAVGAVAGFAASRRGRPGVASAALALDHAVGSDEAFVSALSARDAAPEMRALSAEYALGRCAERDVPRMMHIPTPATAAAAALATAALCAVVLVPPAQRPAVEFGDAQPPVIVPAPSGDAASGDTGVAVSPEARVARLADAAKRGDAESVAALAPAVRGDLAAVSDDDLRMVAEALAAGGDSDARDALDRLAKGDRAGAVHALRRALGFRDAGAGADVVGGSDAGASASVPGASADPRLPASWPLRYDREVRQWLGMRNEDRREERK